MRLGFQQIGRPFLPANDHRAMPRALAATDARRVAAFMVLLRVLMILWLLKQSFQNFKEMLL
jgi:hypothetical protein